MLPAAGRRRAGLLLREVPQLAALRGPGTLAVTQLGLLPGRPARCRRAVLRRRWSLGLLLVVTVPRCCNLLVTPDRVYRAVRHPLLVAPDDRPADQPSSSPGSSVTAPTSSATCAASGTTSPPVVADRLELRHGRCKHDNPFLSAVGRGTVVADGLSFINADYSSTSFRVSRVWIGARQLPRQPDRLPGAGPDGRQLPAGDEGHGADRRGGPGGRRAARLAQLRDPAHGRPGQQARRADRATSGAAAWPPRTGTTSSPSGCSCWPAGSSSSCVTLLGPGAVDLYPASGCVAVAAADRRRPRCSPSSTSCWSTGRPRPPALRPKGCSIYDRGFWRHERYWKVLRRRTTRLFNGTPFKTVLWRMLGVRIGRRVFDDGCDHRAGFVTIGDHCTLNAGSVVQCHSQEDDAFKSDRIAIGAGCTLGVGAFVHYGVTIGDGAVLEPDSFLMKGEEIAPHRGGAGTRRWRSTAPREMPGGGGRTAGAGVGSGRSGGPPGRPPRRPYDAGGAPRYDNDRCGTDLVSGRSPPGNGGEGTGWQCCGVRPGVLARCARRGRVHRDPAVDARPGAGHRPKHDVAVPRAWRRCAAGGRAGGAVSAVLLAAHAKVLAALSGEQEVATGYVARAAGRCPAG